MHVTSELLSKVPGLLHGFGTLEENVAKPLIQIWESKSPVWNQSHGVRSVELVRPKQECGDCDALFTFQKGLPVAVRTADCVPILLARRAGGAVAAVHAGWRGTRGRIVQELLRTLALRGERPEDWVAAVGPAIGPCCYEVSQELARDFARAFPRYGLETSRPSDRYLDLPAINEGQLREAGIGDVQLLRACTRCAGLPASPLFHSFRREGKGYRQFSTMLIT
jgi:YfiH family protein